MASGDRSRTWFAEMIEALREQWHVDLAMEELIALAERLDRMLTQIRTERQIKPPAIYCPECGQRSLEGEPRVSVRATILAAGRFGIGEPPDVKAQERSWKKYRSEAGLDQIGRASCRERVSSPV